MLTISKILSPFFGVFILLASASASAQFNVQDCNADVTNCSLILSSTSSSTTALAGGLIFTVVLGADQGTAMRKFLRQNRVALLADVSAGWGESLNDFAFLMGVPEEGLKRFSIILRHRRKEFKRFIGIAIRGSKGTQRFIAWVSKFET